MPTTPAVAILRSRGTRSAAALRAASSTGLGMFTPKLARPISDARNSISGARIRPPRSSAMRKAEIAVVGSRGSAVGPSASSDARLPPPDCREFQTPRFSINLTLGPISAVVRRSAAALTASKGGPTRAVSTPEHASARAVTNPAGPVPITAASIVVMDQTNLLWSKAVRRRAATTSSSQHRFVDDWQLLPVAVMPYDPFAGQLQVVYRPYDNDRLAPIEP